MPHIPPFLKLSASSSALDLEHHKGFFPGTSPARDVPLLRVTVKEVLFGIFYFK